MAVPNQAMRQSANQMRLSNNLTHSANLMKFSQTFTSAGDGAKIVLVGPKGQKANEKVGIARLEKYDPKTDSRYEYNELTENDCQGLVRLKNSGKLKMLVCLTMYNEDSTDLCRSLDGIYENLKYFPDDDEMAVICVIDGFDKVHPTVVDYINKIGLFRVDSSTYKAILDSQKDPKRAGQKLPSKAAFLFGRKVESVLPKKRDDHLNVPDGQPKPRRNRLNLYFCIKLKNSGKLTSHKWFFLGFCNYLNPHYCMLLDAGTRPSSRAIFRFNEAFEMDKQIGGVCGNMGVILNKAEFPLAECCVSCSQRDVEEIDRVFAEAKTEESYKSDAKKEAEALQRLANARAAVLSDPRQKADIKKADPNDPNKLEYEAITVDDVDEKWKGIQEEEKKRYAKIGFCTRMWMRVIWVLNFIFGNIFYVLIKIFLGLEYAWSVTFSTFINVQFAQIYEYEISHILDKSMESFFGFIQVLPGAFSAYRWEAIKSDKLMRKYFATVLEEGKDDLACQEANVYLAEDRVMCFNIFAMRHKNFTLKYIEDAKAWTDVMTSLVRLISQRRRWLNGSWFAGLHVLDNTLDIELSDHSFFRKTGFYILTMYNVVTTILSYISISLFYTSLNITAQSIAPNLGEDPTEDLTLSHGIVLLFDGLLLAQIFISLTYKVHEPEVQIWYRAVFLIMGLFTYGAFVLIIYYIINQFFLDSKVDWGNFSNLVSTATPVMWSIVITALSYIVPILLNWGHMLRLGVGALSSIFYQPMYMIVIPIYAYCNLDDVSWGTREDAGDKKADRERLTQSYKDFKSHQVFVWIIVNLGCSYIFLYWLQRDMDSRATVLAVFVYIFTGVLFFKALFACCFKIQETLVYLCRCGCFSLSRAKSEAAQRRAQQLQQAGSVDIHPMPTMNFQTAQTRQL